MFDKVITGVDEELCMITDEESPFAEVIVNVLASLVPCILGMIMFSL
ncbi:MAG: hypothetical protein BWY27_01420 [Bacteroidetes bacterium ADurb.Bin234]|nr:MAG: hypothetical protein BWY27_01420 [Bacteroidetes bacterium ADurb.Bin234]